MSRFQDFHRDVVAHGNRSLVPGPVAESAVSILSVAPASVSAAIGPEMHTIEILELYVDLQLTHPLVLLSMAAGFAFSSLLSLWIFFRLFKPHRTLSRILFVVLFFMTMAVSIGMLHLSYNAFVAKASSVGVTGFAGNLIFLLAPFACGLVLGYCLFKKKDGKS